MFIWLIAAVLVHFFAMCLLICSCSDTVESTQTHARERIVHEQIERQFVEIDLFDNSDSNISIIEFLESDSDLSSFYSHFFQNLAKFNLSALGLGTASSRVFLNEHLTERNMKIFNIASQHKRAPGSTFKKVATRNGLVYIMLAGNVKNQLVSLEELLQGIIDATKTTPNQIATNNPLAGLNAANPLEEPQSASKPAEVENWGDSAADIS